MRFSLRLFIVHTYHSLGAGGCVCCKQTNGMFQVRSRWWRWYGALEFDRPLALSLVLVPRLRTLPATGGLYPNNLVCSKAADKAIGGVLIADEFVIALPLPATTELVAGKLEAPEFADDIEAALPKCLADVLPLLSIYVSGNPTLILTYCCQTKVGAKLGITCCE